MAETLKEPELQLSLQHSNTEPICCSLFEKESKVAKL
jgi:hypothetical protein